MPIVSELQNVALTLDLRYDNRLTINGCMSHE